MNKNKTMFAVALPLIAVSSMLPAARNNNECAPEPPAHCYPDDCCRTYCLGPENYGVNAAVRPRTCNGDWVITVAGFYWNAHQDGMEYAVDSQVTNTFGDDRISIINADYKNPHFDWEFGFKLGVGYNTTCDGWDIGVIWTRYNGKASSHVEAEHDDNHTLLPLWSNYGLADAAGVDIGSLLPTYASDIETHWNLHLNLVDIELGREFWNSKRVTLRPHIGLRIASIKQKYAIEHKGGTWAIFDEPTFPEQDSPQTNKVDIDNHYQGVGIRGGLDSVWNFGCGWALYGDAALSIVYGRFDIDHDEQNRSAAAPFTKSKFFETKDHFRASRLIADLAIGLQWSALFCDCQYGFTAKLGWENHLFLDQNQMFRVTKGYGYGANNDNLLLNQFSQSRGDLDTQGWTLTFVFDF